MPVVFKYIYPFFHLGMLGDCWLLAAIAGLTQYKGLLHQVVPRDCEFNDESYCGVFRFRFWQYGQWEEVVVDDRLPTYNNKLVFLHSTEKNEFWSALLEKAYAKLSGSYEGLKGGRTSEAMADFTGGVTEVFDLKTVKPNFFKLLCKAQDRQSLMCCSIESKKGEEKLDNGLIMGHAYTVTGVRKLNDFELVRIRNPWGNEQEWNGAWSDGSEEWKRLSDEDKQSLGLRDEDDGEFWMCFEDFANNFTRLEICMLSPDSAGDSDRKRWEMQLNQGTWQKHVSAGGCRNFKDTFHSNPQYKVHLEDPDDDDEEINNCSIVLGLIQKGRRNIKRVGAQNLTIGFSIYKLNEDQVKSIDEDGRLPKEFFSKNKSYARSKDFVNAREVTERFSMPPGDYVIVPSTYAKNEEGDFILRMFSEKAQSSTAMDTQTKIEEVLQMTSVEEESELEEKLKPFFEEYAGANDEMNAFELQTALSMVLQKDFPEMHQCSLEACRSLVAMVDKEKTGMLDFKEFKQLWKTILRWKSAFIKTDDGSGDLDFSELRIALNKLGFKLSTPVLSSIALRYANRNGYVNIDDFLQICCRVKTTFEAYSAYKDRTLSLDNYIQSAIYT